MLQRLLALSLAFGLAACSVLPLNAVAPKVSVAAIDIKRLGLFEQRFDVGLRVSNPNEFGLTIEALDFELEVNGRPFAKGQTQTATLIPATSSTVMRLETVTQSENLIEQVKTLSPETLKEGVPYRIRGRVKIDRSSSWLPFDHSGIVGSNGKKPKGGI